MSDERAQESPAAATSRRHFIAGATVMGLGAKGAIAAGAGTPEVASQAWFEAYLAAFNRADEAVFGSYYTDDIQFFGQAAQVTGRQAVLDFYRKVREHLQERVELLTYVGDPARQHALAVIRTTLTAHRDWPDMPTGPLKAGDRRESVSFVMYDIKDGRFSRVRSARFSPQKGRAA
ncbi:MAG: nuclear transport factor 2 family protein [Sphingomonas sp.]|nr:nuclear transport factor 2 family protein [Sphingomonas sp.]